MPRYRDTQTGRVITVEGGEPTDDELDAMFADGGDTFRMRAPEPERTSTVRPIPPGAVPGGRSRMATALSNAQEPRIPIGVDPRMEPEVAFTESEFDLSRAAIPAALAGMGSVAAGGPAALGVAGRLAGAGVVGRAVKGAAIGAGMEALPGVGGGNYVGGAVDGALTAVGLGALGGGKAASTVARRAGTAAIKKVATEGAVKASRRTAATVAKKAAERAPRAAAKAAPVAVEKAAPVAAATVSKGAEAAARHKAQMEFARAVAAKDPKVGEKIWLLLDEAGRPIKQLTATEAAAAARKKLQTTWFRNLWSAK